MLIDQSRDPIIFLRTSAAANDSIETQFEQLLQRPTPFVLITDHHEHDHNHQDTPEERKQKALFFKRVRGRLRSLCLGMIVIDGDKPSPIAARLAARAISKALGFSVLFAASEDQAVHEATRLLTENGAFNFETVPGTR